MSLPQLADDLRDEIDALSGAVVASIWEVLPGYTTEHLTCGDLEQFAMPHLRLLLATLSEQRRAGVEELELAGRLGASRALQGVPLPSVLQAYRAAERALLDAVLSRAEQLPARVVAEAIKTIGNAIDDLVQASVEAYRHAQAEITVRYEHLDADLVHDLVASDEVDPAEVAQRARLVGAEPDASYLAVAAAMPGPHSGAQRLRMRRQLLADIATIVQGRILTGSWGPSSVLIVPCHVGAERLCSVVNRALTRSGTNGESVVGVGEPTERLSLVGRSCREALAAVEVASRLGQSSGVVRFVDVIPGALLLRDRETSRCLVSARLGNIAENQTLITTLRTYLSMDLSVRRTAEALHVHQNTVSYRLRQVGARTGRDLRRTGDVCDLHLALMAADLLAAATPE